MKDGQHVLVGLKASEGSGFIDKTHASRSEGAHKAGAWVLHYHFGHPGSSASVQAKFFWNQIHGHFAAKDFACIDIEVTDGQTSREISNWVEVFTVAFKAASGHSLIGYSGESFLGDIGRSGISRWWIAAYGPREPSGAWAWQFTDGKEGPQPHACAGIGNCDISKLNWATYLRLRLRRPPA